MINIIISVEGLQKISDRLYIRGVAKFITILYITKFIITNDRYIRYQISNKYQINGEMHPYRTGFLTKHFYKFHLINYKRSPRELIN